MAMRSILVVALALASTCWHQRADALPLLIVNCLRAASPPPTGTCFNARVGRPYTFWVVALDATAHIDPTFVGTIHVSASDPTAVLPQDYTFKLNDQGAARFSATFNTASAASTQTIASLEELVATDAADSLQGRATIYLFAGPAPVVSTVPLLESAAFLGTLILLVAAVAALQLSRRGIIGP
jgi:hypothetical protein